jgi:hypothetical protein
MDKIELIIKDVKEDSSANEKNHLKKYMQNVYNTPRIQTRG